MSVEQLRVFKWLVVENFRRLRRNFFLDSPFIEPLAASTISALNTQTR
jgi:hypothetical protein